MRKSRVCCYLERWESGGIESFLYNVITRLDMSRLEIDIVAAEIKDSVFTADLQDKGVRFVELSGDQHKLCRNYKKFRELLAERRYDVVHLNAFQGLTLYYLQQAKDAGVPVRIAHSHNTDLRHSPGRAVKLSLHKWAKNKWTGAATCLWACSKQAAEFLFAAEQLKERGFTFIPNGIDTERFRFDPAVREQDRGELGIEDKFVIGNVGRLCYQKNQGFLLDVLAEVLKIRSEAVLLLVGEGEDKESLQAKAERLGLADKVIFYGTCKEIERLYWAMDVFVLPSRFEGLPVTVVEAGAAGLSVIASECMPQEVKAFPLVHIQSLSDGAGKWAEQIIAGAQMRQDGADKIRECGFDIRDLSARLEKTYLKA